MPVNDEFYITKLFTVDQTGHIQRQSRRWYNNGIQQWYFWSIMKNFELKKGRKGGGQFSSKKNPKNKKIALFEAKRGSNPTPVGSAPV